MKQDLNKMIEEDKEKTLNKLIDETVSKITEPFPEENYIDYEHARAAHIIDRNFRKYEENEEKIKEIKNGPLTDIVFPSLYVYLIRSRNKDNKDIPGFKERSKTILEWNYNERKVIEKFEKFTKEGLPGEKVRLYRTVNARNMDKIRKNFIIRLLSDNVNMTKLNRVLASVSQMSDVREESKWLFDFDCKDEDKVKEFVLDCKRYSNDAFVELHETPNGYAIVVSHGFDTRKLMTKWLGVDITLKKDGLLFLDMKVNE